MYYRYKALTEIPGYRLGVHEGDFYSYGFHSDSEEAESFCENDETAEPLTVLLLKGDEAFADSLKYYDCKMLETTTLPSVSSLVKWTDRRIQEGNIFLSRDERQLLAIMKSLALHAPAGSIQVCSVPIHGLNESLKNHSTDSHRPLSLNKQPTFDTPSPPAIPRFSESQPPPIPTASKTSLFPNRCAAFSCRRSNNTKPGPSPRSKGL